MRTYALILIKASPIKPMSYEQSSKDYILPHSSPNFQSLLAADSQFTFVYLGLELFCFTFKAYGLYYPPGWVLY